jgi:putative endonuclease
MQNTKEIGNHGEHEAVSWLQRNGFRIKTTNWFWGHLEIDIVAEKNDILHIIEVKTRRSNRITSPEYSVNKTKQKNLIRAANAYINRYNLDMDVQFDIFCILKNDLQKQIDFIEDAFYPIVK